MVTSRLGQSLLRLERSLAEIRREEERAEAALDDWRNRWRDQKDRIARRLEFIESQLNEREEEKSEPAPQLTIVGGTAEPASVTN